MKEQTKKYKITIYGETYTLVSDESEASVIKSAQLVDEFMRNVSHNVGIVDTKKIAVLAALRMACMVVEGQEQKARFEREKKQLDELVDYGFELLTSQH